MLDVGSSLALSTARLGSANEVMSQLKATRCIKDCSPYRHPQSLHHRAIRFLLHIERLHGRQRCILISPWLFSSSSPLSSFSFLVPPVWSLPACQDGGRCRRYGTAVTKPARCAAAVYAANKPRGKRRHSAAIKVRMECAGMLFLLHLHLLCIPNIASSSLLTTRLNA